jgi:predicted DNA-binding protein (MmcQ/YjbR family)
VNDVAFDMLTTEGPGTPAPYPARDKWVCLASPADLNEADLRSYLMESHRLATGRTTRSTARGNRGVLDVGGF